MAKFPEISHFFTLHDSLLAVICKRRVTQKLRNSSVLYHKTKNPFEAKIFINHVKTNNMEKTLQKCSIAKYCCSDTIKLLIASCRNNIVRYIYTLHEYKGKGKSQIEKVGFISCDLASSITWQRQQ